MTVEEKLNILMIGRLPGKKIGGIEQYTKMIIDNFNFVNITLLLPRDNKIKYSRKIKIISIPKIGFNLFTETLSFSLFCWLLLPFVIKLSKPDIIHIQYGNYFDLFYIIWGKILQISVVITMHISKQSKHLHNKYLRKLSLVFLSWANVIVCINQIQQGFFHNERYRKNNLMYIPIAISDAYYNSEFCKIISCSTKKILFLGRVTKDKGVEDLLIIAKKLMTKREVSFNIVGPVYNRYLKKLYEIVRESGISDIVNFPGPVFNIEKKIELYQQAYIFVYPSYKDASPLSICEAMACGCPVISTDIAGIKEIVQSAAILVPPGDTEKLYSSIISLIDNEKLHYQLSTEAKNIVQKYRISSFCKEYKKLYYSIVKKML